MVHEQRQVTASHIFFHTAQPVRVLYDLVLCLHIARR